MAMAMDMGGPTSFLLVLSIGLAASAYQQDSFNVGKVAHSKDDAYYDFRYAVDDEKSGVVTDRWESRSGQYVKGAYSLLGPDGKVRSVHYEVDGDHGFKAIVRTDTPGLSLLSIQSAHQVRLAHADPPVNKAQAGLLPEPQHLSSPGDTGAPFNYHARPGPRPRPPPRPDTDPLQHSSLLQEPSPASSYASVPILHESSLFSNDLLHRPIFDDESLHLQALQELTPPIIDTFARSYDSYPRPVKTNPNRRQEQPVQDVHRTVYSDYVNKELQRINPLRSARLAGAGPPGPPGPPGPSRGLIQAPMPLKVTVVTPRAKTSTVKHVDQVTYQPAPFPFSRRYSTASQQFLTERSPQSFSYFT